MQVHQGKGAQPVLPSRKALMELTKSPHSINDYTKAAPTIADE